MTRCIAALCLASVLALPLASAGERDLSALLPYGTIAYLKVSHFHEGWQRLQKSPAREQILAMIKREGGLDPPNIAAIEALLGRIRSVHLSLQGLTAYRRTVDLDALAVLEMDGAVEVEKVLPPLVRPFFQALGDHAGAKVFELGGDVRSRKGLTVYLAASGDRLLVATDLALIEGFLTAEAKGRKRSLAGDPGFRELRRRQSAAPLELFVDLPRLLLTIDATVDRHDREEYRAVMKVLGLADAEYVALAADGRRATLRFLMNPDSPALQLLAQPAGPRRFTAYVPESAVLCAGQTVGDGARTWRRGKQYLYEFLLNIGEVRSRERFDRDLAQAQAEVGLDFEKAAALIAEFGVFLDGRFDEDALCLFAKLKDAERGKEMLRGFLASRAMGRRREEPKSYEHLGVTIHLERRDFCWALVDDYLFIAPKKQAIEKVVTAARLSKIGVPGQGKAIRLADRYRKLAALLPKQDSSFAYLDVGRLLTGELRREFRDVPPALLDALKDLAAAASLRVEDDVVELVIAQSERLDFPGLLSSVLHAAGRNAGQEAMKARSAGNLKGLVQASHLWLNKYGGAVKYPPSLKALLDNEIITEPRLFLHPSRTHLAKQKVFVTDYDSLWDRVGHSLTDQETPVSMPAAWEKRTFYRDGGRNVAFVDSHVEYVSPRGFQQLMQQVDKFVAKHKARKKKVEPRKKEER